jgi:hypothetical protein
MLRPSQGARFRAPLSGTAGLAQAGTQEDTRQNCVYVRRRDPVEHDSQHEREARAARNQALFRAVNEKLRDLDEQFASMTYEYVIACECADTTCVQTLTISADDYKRVRANPRAFVVLPGHVYADVEDVISEAEPYVVVEKLATAGKVAEQAAAQDQ